MKDLLVLLAHLLTTVAKLLGPGGARAVVALADAILDRLLHNAHRPPLKGESMRKKQQKLDGS